KDQPDWLFGADVTEDGRFLIVVQNEGTKPENRGFVKDLSRASAGIVPLLDKFDAEYSVVGNDGERFYVQTDKDAPRRRVVAIDLARPDSTSWSVVIPESSGRDVLSATRMVNNRFVTQWMTDAHDVLKVFAATGAFERGIALPTVGAISGFTGKGKDTRGFRGFPLRLRYGNERGLPAAESGLLAFGVRNHPGVLLLEGRHEDSDVRDVQEGHEEGRAEPGLPLRVWRIQRVADAGVLAGDDRLDGGGRHFCATESARRRRIRQSVVRRRAARPQAECLRRLPCGRRLSVCRAVHAQPRG